MKLQMKVRGLSDQLILFPKLFGFNSHIAIEIILEGLVRNTQILVQELFSSILHPIMIARTFATLVKFQASSSIISLRACCNMVATTSQSLRLITVE